MDYYFRGFSPSVQIIRAMQRQSDEGRIFRISIFIHIVFFFEVRLHKQLDLNESSPAIRSPLSIIAVVTNGGED